MRREFKRHLFVVDSLDKQMQDEEEPIRLASAGVGELFCIKFFVGSINLTCVDLSVLTSCPPREIWHSS